jgi:hypothetical protein
MGYLFVSKNNRIKSILLEKIIILTGVAKSSTTFLLTMLSPQDCDGAGIAARTN